MCILGFLERMAHLTSTIESLDPVQNLKKKTLLWAAVWLQTWMDGTSLDRMGDTGCISIQY